MWPWTRQPLSTPSAAPPEPLPEAILQLRGAIAELRVAVAELEATQKAMRRDLDDQDDTLRRVRGRRDKVAALEAVPDPEPTKPPTIAQLRAAGRLPWK